ncbi:MAG: aminoacyl-histidine dipeptidase [Clostridia bacterium]|nr:aminoacyl-histidine dipeptidase [Clostridia bacterium]
MSVLAKIKPERVFYYFEELSKIPHGSGNMDKISSYCVDFAKGLGLEVIKDEHNNVIIKKPASAGYEHHETIILQGHLDMVCEKDGDSPIDFMKDGLDLRVDGDLIYAKGTTLGGDDGIAIAMTMAILEDKALIHPPIEALFTTDEETGMYGAEGLDGSKLSGKTLINIDSEEEGILTVSCAGGARAGIEIPLVKETVSAPCFKITVDGLIGGHSGVEIDKGRLNSNIVMGRLLNSLPFNYNIINIQGGLKDNAIPRTTEAIISCNGNITSICKDFVEKNRVATDPGLVITVEDVSYTDGYDQASSKSITDFLCTVPNGVQAMSKDIEGLVQTSLNLGILHIENNKLVATFAVRSSVNTEKSDLLDKLDEVAKVFGGQFESHAHYPAWEYRKNSRLRDTMTEVYTKLYGTAPQVVAIHAGLECGLLSDKINDLDAVSFGPNLYDIHTSRERMSIESVKRTYDYLIELLKNL